LCRRARRDQFAAMNLALPAAVTAFALLPLLPLLPQDPAKKPADAPAKVDAAALKQLEWLCGTWVLEDGKSTTEEHWRPLQGSTLLGSSHTFTADRTRAFEQLRIVVKGGTLAYVASPNGAAPTSFELAKLEQHAVEFANAEHDYPQRIRYQRTDAGVTATISLLDGGKAQQFVFKKKG
jgi:hypothetical protein